MKRIQVLESIEKHEENEMSFFGNRFKNVSELKKYDSETDKGVKMPKNQREHLFSGMKVINDIQRLHPRSHPSYSIRLDRKFLKLLTHRSYRRENLYEIFRTVYQVLNVTFLNIERSMTTQNQNERKKQNVSFTSGLVKKLIKFSRLNTQSIALDLKKKERSHGNRMRNISKIVNSIYKNVIKRCTERTDEIDDEEKKISVFKKFEVKLIDTENWSKKDLDRHRLGISAEDILNRLFLPHKCSIEDLPRYKIFGRSSGLFFVITFEFSKEVTTRYNSRMMK